MLATAQRFFDFDPDPVLPLVRDRLRERYGPQRDAQRADPLDVFVLAMLSWEEQDDVSFAAFERLRRHYAPWDRLIEAPARSVAALLLPVRYADEKARYLPNALRMLRARHGSVNLGFLADLPVEMGIRALMGLDRVGIKTAAATLNFSTLRKRTLAVDRHMLRVGHRLRLLPNDRDHRRAHAIYMSLVPDAWDADDLYEFHWLMKLHSQRVCTFDGPACEACPLKDSCYPRAASLADTSQAGIFPAMA